MRNLTLVGKSSRIHWTSETEARDARSRYFASGPRSAHMVEIEPITTIKGQSPVTVYTLKVTDCMTLPASYIGYVGLD